MTTSDSRATFNTHDQTQYQEASPARGTKQYQEASPVRGKTSSIRKRRTWANLRITRNTRADPGGWWRSRQTE
eukprot:1034370-Pyramimonas_sp.AAC.1